MLVVTLSVLVLLCDRRRSSQSVGAGDGFLVYL